MALTKKITITTLVKNTITSIVLPSVGIGLTAKMLGIQLWTTGNVRPDIELYEGTTLVKRDVVVNKRELKTILCCDYGNFFDATLMKIKVDENNCFATTYFIIE